MIRISTDQSTHPVAAKSRRPSTANGWDKLFTASAVTGAVLALILTPIQSFVWNGATAPPLVRALGPLHELAGQAAQAVSADADPYYFYGRAFVMVYLGALGGLATLRRRSRDVTGAPPIWLRVLTLTMAVAAILDVLAYSGTTSNLPFFAEMLVIVIGLIAATLHGRQILRTRALPRWTGWSLVASIPFAIVCTVLTQYLPHAGVLPLSLSFAALAVGTSYGRGRSRRRKW
jgi:hypothetical protein